ncbi:hypothetical protein CBS14141_001138 [Malassezia furfur]|nr:hypothetical protein CBS14141_001138 [Malassezia furfur]
MPLVPGAPGLPKHSTPQLASTPPRPTAYEVHKDLRPPERPFARTQGGGMSPARSMAGFGSQASLVPSGGTSMIDMHVGLDPTRSRSGVDVGDTSSVRAAPTEAAPNTPDAARAADTTDTAPQGAAFDSESDHDTSSAGKPKRQTFKGFFRKMERTRARKARTSAAESGGSPDLSWGDPHEDASRAPFWSKLGKKPIATRFVSGGAARPARARGARTHELRHVAQHAQRRAPVAPPPPNANWLLDSPRDASVRAP